MKNKYYRGSNQYKQRSKNKYHYFYWYMLIVGVVMFAGHLTKSAHAEFNSPLPEKQVAYETITPTVTPSPTPTEHQLIEKEIDEVFGKDAWKFKKLLTCENRSWNPRAVNTNNDGIGSKDYGIAQINNHWQGVTNEAFLFDYKINIRLAYNIYSRDGHSFKLWTCGRALGI